MAINVPGGILEQTDVRETITNTEESSVRFNTVYARFESKLALGTGLKDLYINPEGTELYTCDDGDDIKQWTLSTKWTLNTATLTHTLDVSGKETALLGLFFKPDGTKMYTLGDAGNSIDEYDLSIPWAISSAVYLQELDISGEGALPGGLFIREDGKQVYTRMDADKVVAYHISTPWDITTAVKQDEIAMPFTGRGLHFSRDGSTLFAANNTTNIQIWTMTSVFRISTASADTTFELLPNANIQGVRFSPNGTRMYLLSATDAYEYTIKRGWR